MYLQRTEGKRTPEPEYCKRKLIHCCILNVWKHFSLEYQQSNPPKSWELNSWTVFKAPWAATRSYHHSSLYSSGHFGKNLESNGNTRHKSSTEISKSRKEAEKGTRDVLTAPHRREPAVAALPEGNGTLPEGAGQHSEFQPGHSFQPSGGTVLLYQQWRIFISNHDSWSEKQRGVCSSRHSSSFSYCTNKFKVHVPPLIVPELWARSRKSPLAFPHMPPWLTTYINMLLTFIALYCFRQQEPLLIFLVVTDNINFSNTSLLLQLQKQSTRNHTIHHIQTLNCETFLLLKLNSVGKSLLSFSYKAYILTLVISFFFKNYTTPHIMIPSLCTLTLQHGDQSIFICPHTMGYFRAQQQPKGLVN